MGLIYSRIKKEPIAGPLHGSIIATYCCNLRCSMCNLWKRPKEYSKLGKKNLQQQVYLRMFFRLGYHPEAKEMLEKYYAENERDFYYKIRLFLLMFIDQHK